MNLINYYFVGKTNFQNALMYVGDLFAGSIFIGMIVFVFAHLWMAIYSGGQIIEGYTIAMMLWYFVMTESIVTSFSTVIEDIGDEIQSGEIANYLNKPYNYFLYKYFVYFTPAVLKFSLTLTIGLAVAIFFVGVIPMQLLNMLLVIVSIILAITLHFTMMAFLGVFGFWFEDARSLYFIYTKIVFTLGGMLIPLELFPNLLGSISQMLPFSYVAYYPAKLFVMFSVPLFAKVVLFQILWIAFFAGLIAILYKIGVKRVSINGG
jgi:ABC-2 type transport system permease protein